MNKIIYESSYFDTIYLKKENIKQFRYWENKLLDGNKDNDVLLKAISYIEIK